MTLRAADVTSLISRVSFIILVEQDGLFVNQPEFPNAAVILILIYFWCIWCLLVVTNSGTCVRESMSTAKSLEDLWYSTMFVM